MGRAVLACGPSADVTRLAGKVENAIASHPGVLQVAVIGIPSDKWGEAVHAVVVLKPGRDVTPDELIAHCRERIAAYKEAGVTMLSITPVGGDLVKTVETLRELID